MNIPLPALCSQLFPLLEGALSRNEDFQAISAPEMVSLLQGASGLFLWPIVDLVLHSPTHPGVKFSNPFIYFQDLEMHGRVPAQTLLSGRRFSK